MDLELKVLEVYKYGEVHLLINGKEYTYLLDGAHLSTFRKLMRRSHGKALNFLKKVSKEVIKCKL